MIGVIVEVDGKRQTFELVAELVIGRDKSCPVCIDDPRSSRQHCRIIKQDDGYYVSDLNSRNGTLVNGEKITRRKLKDHDRITIGRTVIIYEESLVAEPQQSPERSIGAEPQQSPERSIGAEPPANAAPAQPKPATTPPVLAPNEVATTDLSSGIKKGSPDIAPLGKSDDLVRQIAQISTDAESAANQPTKANIRTDKSGEPTSSGLGAFFLKVLLLIGLLVFFLVILFISKWAGDKFISSLANRSSNPTPATVEERK